MRKKRTRFNPIKSEIVILDGGLNESVSSLELKPGELIKCLNYQHVLGSQGGYQSIAGYERFDGRTKPSTIGAPSDDPTARETQRALIGPVPGAGPVRGIRVFRDYVFAFRDTQDGTHCKMFKSSNRGWEEIDTSNSRLSPGGDFHFFEYNFFGGVTGTSPSSSPSAGTPSGTASNSASPSSSPSAGTPSDSPSSSPTATPSEGTPSSTPSSSPSAGTPSDTPSGSPSGSLAYTGTPSDTPSSSPSSSPSAGTPSVTPSATDELSITSLNLFFADGQNKCHRFDGKRIYPITTGMAIDKPTNVVVHNERLFLAFSGGSLQYSAAGDPTDWGTSAGEYGVGAEITNLVSGVGNALIIFLRNGIRILNGNGPDDWVMDSFSTESGAYAKTAKRLFGTVFFMDDRGVTSLEAVDAFGDFQSNSISEKVYNTLQQNKELITTACVSRDLNQYRLFFSNGYVLYFSFRDRKLRGVTLALFDDPVSFVTSGEDENGDSVIFFTSGTTGLVYQMDSGTSFDGGEITTRLSTAYYHYKSPRSWKKFKTLVFEISTQLDLEVSITPDYNYGSDTAPRGGTLLESLSGTGSLWGDDEWGELVYASGGESTSSLTYHVLGMGRNMNVTFRTESRFNLPHTIQNYIVDFEQIGRQM